MVPRICSSVLGTMDPLLFPYSQKGKLSQGVLHSKQRAGLKPEPKFLNNQLNTHLASQQVCVIVPGLGVCDILPRVTVDTLHSDFGRALYQAGALPVASHSTLADHWFGQTWVQISMCGFVT